LFKKKFSIWGNGKIGDENAKIKSAETGGNQEFFPMERNLSK
jgi:hypothetical protein